MCVCVDKNPRDVAGQRQVACDGYPHWNLKTKQRKWRIIINYIYIYIFFFLSLNNLKRIVVVVVSSGKVFHLEVDSYSAVFCDNCYHFFLLLNFFLWWNGAGFLAGIDFHPSMMARFPADGVDRIGSGGGGFLKDSFLPSQSLLHIWLRKNQSKTWLNEVGNLIVLVNDR